MTTIPVEPPSPPDDLVEALATGNCILFVGAEVAGWFSVSSWQKSIERIVEHVAGDHPEYEWESLRGRLAVDETALVTDLLRGRIGPDELHRAIAASASPVGGAVDASFRRLAHLPFAGVVTDLWSDQVPALFADRKPTRLWPGSSDDASMLLLRDRFFVAQAHGTPSEPDTLCLSWEDYRDAVTADPTFGRFVTTLLRSRTILFLGAHESDIESFLLTSEVRGAGNLRHCAVVPGHGGIDLATERFRTRFGVRLLPYEPTAAVPQIDAFMEQLATRLPGAPRSRRRGTDRLSLLRLRDIGPFRELDVELDQQATLLVGDNASGKSTILRALALGLAGESVELTRAAGELLRIGASSGSIEIVAGRDVYRTVLRSDRDRDHVAVASERTSPVAAGLLLAVGFPALRGLSLRPPRGPLGGRALPPNPADVIPLAIGEPDARLDDVQQWVIDTWLRSDDSDRGIAGPAREQLTQFFEILGALAPGVDVELYGVDRQTWEVLLRTADGIVPLTQVSRGMTTVLGWVGVLLKRLYEVHPTDAREQDGLLLIDEIDVHVHPAWQREILPLVREQFPRLQVVASTHSPLVVGSAHDAEIVHLRRAHDRIVAKVADERSFRGWRSDQILTSSAFELSTTRDVETEDRLDEYARLTAGGRLDDADRRRAEQLARELHELLPPPQETPAAREAAELVGEALDQRIRELPEQRQRAVAEEALRYLQELREGGSSR